MTFWRGVGLGAGAVVVLGAVAARLFMRPLVNRAVGGPLATLMKDGKYDENMAEMMTAATGRHPRVLMETFLRAERGKAISRPLYTTKRFLHFDDLMFVPAQMAVLPTNENERIDLTTVIGRRARKPLKIDLPVYITGMSFGLSLSDRCKIALAKGSAAVGTATNSGEGGFYASEREHAKHYILQYTRGGWPSDPEVLRKADAIEIQVGQGAQAGSPQSTPGWKLTDEERSSLGLPKDRDAVIHSRFPGVDRPEDFKKLVEHIRTQADGVPVGVKIAAGHKIEEDIAVALAAGVDFVTVDGAQASSHAAQPILLDDFGIPSVMALVRAARALEGSGVSMIISGGFMTPGEILKALALGADAVAVGAAPVMAAVGAQWAKIAPYEPPTQLVWHDGKHRDKFDIDQGAKGVQNWFQAVADELVTAVRCVGKSSVHQVDAQDLCAMTPEIAAVTGVPLAWAAPGRGPGRPEQRPDPGPEVWQTPTETFVGDQRTDPPDPIH